MRYLLAAAVLFSTGGAAIKGASLTPWQIASFRSGLAALALVLLLPEARRAWSPRLIPAAAAYAATLISFVLATRMTTAANAIFLQSTAPIYLLLLGPWLLKEPLRRAGLALAAGIAAGMGLMFAYADPAGATAPDPAAGNVIGAASGIAWALTLASLRKLKEQSPLASVAAGNLAAFVIALPMALPVASFTPRDAAAIGYLGIVQIGLAYVCLTRGLKRVPAFEASAVLLVEPTLNPIWAWIMHGERPGAGSLAGGAVILAALLAHSAATSRRAPGR